MTRVAFVLDYVMHYHRDLLVALDVDIAKRGGQFTLFTADHRRAINGRTPLDAPVVADQRTYRLYERQVFGFWVRYQAGLIPAIRRLRPDVVVSTCHSGTVSEWRLAALKRRLGFRLIAWQCGFEYHPGWIKDTMLSRFVPQFDHHLAYHTNARQYALRYGAGDGQVTVMHNTIDERRIAPGDKDAARAQLAARFPALRGKVIVLYVGALLDEKRLECVIDALDRLQDPRVAFLVVGDGPHRAALAARCAGRPDVVFAGRIVDGVGAIFDAADLFVLPGTGGLALNEAMAHGLPLLSGYADGSADDLVEDGFNGFRLRDGSAELAGHLRTLANDPLQRARMGAHSRELITTRFSFQHFVETVTQCLAH
ncbi:MAG TPA: glycosyltransferase family 4 protein [Gemmatimonadales bacterium]|nr:glycosyltransferase family 4 protein [Gemmatimonadales bacterium]